MQLCKEKEVLPNLLGRSSQVYPFLPNGGANI